MNVELECPHCKYLGKDYTLTLVGPHTQANCEKCNLKIKYLSKEEKYGSIEKKREAFKKTNGFCAYCGINPNPHVKSEYTIDHIIAQNNDGGHDVENLYVCCKSCNSQKGTKSVDDYRAYIEKKLNIENHKFWFELIDAKVTQPKHIAEILKELFNNGLNTSKNDF